MKWGEAKLKQLCQNEMGIDPKKMGIFFNRAQNKLKLFYLDNNGSQELMKFMPEGRFILPDDGASELLKKMQHSGEI